MNDYYTLFYYSPLPHWVYDTETFQILDVNQSAIELYGYSREALLSMCLKDLWPSGDRPEATAEFDHFINQKGNVHFGTFVHLTKNGARIRVDMNGHQVDFQGKKCMLVSCLQVADTVQHTELRRSEEKLKDKFFSQISQIFNRESSFVSASDQLCQLIGDFGDFDVVELWSPNIENTHFQFIAQLKGNPVADRFYELSPTNRSFEISEGLQGMVWEKKSSVLLDKINKGTGLVREEAAKAAGLRSILGIPLTHNEELVGILVVGAGTEKVEELSKNHGLVFQRLEQFLGSEIYRKKLEVNLMHLYDTIPDLICLADFQGRFLKINKAGCELLGYSEEEILYRSFDEFVHPEDKDVSANEVRKLGNGQKTFQFENRFIREDGEIIWLSWTCSTEVKEGLVYASAKNISQEKKLRELNQQASSLAKIGSWEIDVVKNKLYWSEIVHELHETDAQSFEPDLEKGINFYRADFHPMVKKNVDECLRKGTPFDFEAVLVTAQGNEKWVRVIGNAEMVKRSCVRVYGSFQDIHDRKVAEEALRESEAKFRTMFEIASLGIAQVSPEKGQILLVNSYYEAITGYSMEELRQMNFPELTHPEDREQDWELFQKAVKGGVEYRNEKRYIRKDGTVVWVRIHLAFIRDEHAEPIKTVAICENISARKEMESRLKNLSDNVPGVVFQYRIFPDGRDELNYVSKASKEIWGFEPKEVMADNQLVWNRIEAGGDMELVKGSIAESIQDGSRWTAKWKYPLPSGEMRTHIGHGSPEYLADGTVIFNSLILDITGEKRMEDLLNQATSMARIGGWELDLVNQNNDAMYWSPMTRQVLEVDENYNPTLTGGFEFYEPKSRRRIEKAVNRLIQEGTEFDEELMIRTPSGKEKWIRCIGKSERFGEQCVKIFGSFQDIHHAKSNELQLKEILGSISDAFYAVDKNWNFTYFNKEAENLLKKKSTEVLGKNIWEVFAPAKGTVLEELYLRVAHSGNAESFEYQYPGNGFWYEINAYPSHGGISSYFKNITERKKFANELQKAYEEKTRILESIGDAFFAVDKNWTVTYWNKEAENVLGKSREKTLGKNLWEEYADAIDSDFYRQYHQAMETGENVSFEEYYPTLNKWFEVSAYPGAEGLSVYFKDITLRKEADMRILRANERFEKVTEATTDAIWDWDIENKTVFRGKGYEKLFGQDMDKRIGQENLWEAAFHPDDLLGLKQSLEACLDDPSVGQWRHEYRILHREGEVKTVIDKGVIIRDKQGKAIRMVGAVTDISERIKHEEELKALNGMLKAYIKELEMTNEQLEQFAFIASHDLQEPLRMISSFLNQLQRKYGDQLDDKAHQYIHFATDGAKRMKQIILDLLDYSRAGKVMDMSEQIDLHELIEDYRILRRRLIQDKSVSIITENLSLVQGYKAPLTQTIYCLMDNAIKYAKTGQSPQIKVSAEETEAAWTISVRDNGIGIDPKFFDKIFIIFQRLHDRDQYSGTGVGLAIAKKHVESWGGKIGLDSQPGTGSTFAFTLPKLTKPKK